MWCPSVSLAVWANAWLAGQAAPDDVVDALSCWAPRQAVMAYDAVAAGHTGLPWPDPPYAGAVSLLQTLRTAASRPTITGPPIRVVVPVPGDVRGLAAGTDFERDALAVGEALIVADADDPSAAMGLVPDFDDQDREPKLSTLSWTVYALPGAPIVDHQDLGEAEHTLRSAVRSAADALGAIRLGSTGADGADPRALVEEALQSSRRHRLPDHAPSRAVRVLENAAHVDAIITVSSELAPSRGQSSSHAQIADNALRPLAAVVRSARIAAVSAILRSAWQR